MHKHLGIPAKRVFLVIVYFEEFFRNFIYVTKSFPATEIVLLTYNKCFLRVLTRLRLYTKGLKKHPWRTHPFPPDCEKILESF